MLIGDWLLLAAAVLVAVPFVVLGVEALASLLPGRRAVGGDRPPCAILIPAHDEESGIADTLRSVRGQLAPGDRVLVVADNCTDGTAAVARAAGADVAERTDPARRGKGFALDHGLTHLAADPPAVVVVIDADSVLGPGALDILVRQVVGTGRPAQGVYLIGTGQEADPRRRISAFAVLLKNKIRPLGLDRLGLPCLLTGTGMAFTWPALQAVNLGTGNIVEDMQLGVDLSRTGHPPRLCPRAEFYGAAAPDRKATIKQRTRWEHGHVQTSLTQAPLLFLTSLLRARPRLIGLALELAVPPVSLLIVLWAIVLTGCVVWWQAGGAWMPALITAGAAFFGVGGVFLAWIKYGRRMLPTRVLALSPTYVLWKIPIYLRMMVAREKSWVRTDRGRV